MASINFFANAAPAKKGAKGKADIKANVNVDGLLTLARIDAVQKALKAIRATAEEPVKASMAEHFTNVGVALGRRPENYKGTEGVASASLELRCRSSMSALDETQVELLEAEGISTEHVQVFALNQEVLTPAVMALVEKALNGVKGIPPNIFTVTSKTIVAENALNEIFTKGASKARALLDVVGVLATKPKAAEDFNDTLDAVSALLKGN